MTEFSGISKTTEMIRAMQQEGLETATEIRTESQVASQESLIDETKDITIMIKDKKPAPPERLRTEKAQRAQESVLVRKEEADGLADGFTKREGNRQFRLDPDQLSRLAQALGKEITEATDNETIIAFVRNTLFTGEHAPDVAQIDRTFDFLLEVVRFKMNKATGTQKESLQAILNRVNTAKSFYYEANKRDIDIAQKIIDVVDVVVEQGARDTPETISHLRDIINNPQDVPTKLNYYKSKGYTYQEMKQEVDAILSFVGAKFKNARIPKGEMSRLMDETRNLQALLQVFRHFKRGMPLARNLFDMNGMKLSPNINFETLSQNFMTMVEDGYPSSQKVLQTISKLDQAAPAA